MNSWTKFYIFHIVECVCVCITDVYCTHTYLLQQIIKQNHPFATVQSCVFDHHFPLPSSLSLSSSLTMFWLSFAPFVSALCAYCIILTFHNKIRMAKLMKLYKSNSIYMNCTWRTLTVQCTQAAPIKHHQTWHSSKEKDRNSDRNGEEHQMNKHWQ